VVAYLGSYDPHTKTTTLDSQRAAQYLQNGAQPSDRVAKLLQNEGVKLPAWVKLDEPKKGSVRHPEKRRSTRPAEAALKPEPAQEPAIEDSAAPAVDESPPAGPTGQEATPPEAATAEPAEAEDSADETASQS
jgi:small subunit ribosomal protein S16